MEYEISFLKALAITIVIETSVLVILFRTVYKEPKSGISLLIFTGIIASFSTLPYLWFILPIFIRTRLPYMITGEVMAIAIESIIIAVILRIKFFKALVTSFICNMSSFLIGLIINIT